jgi:FlaG/FlaF family flagellin (archaellin)
VSRALTPVVGVVLLAAVAVVAAGAVGTLALTEPPDAPPQATFSLSVDADTGRVALTHEGGDTLDVSALDVTVSVGGTELTHQPPVPFFAARGFRGGPTGPFNAASDGSWGAGGIAAVRLAGTNEPSLSAGDTVTVVLSTESAVLARLEATAT